MLEFYPSLAKDTTRTFLDMPGAFLIHVFLAQGLIRAVAAGAVGMIIFNQGNAPDRIGVFAGTFGGPIGIVAVPASFDLGVDLAGIGGLEMLIDTDPNDGATLRVQALAGLDWDRAEEFVPLIGKIDVDGNITRFDD